MKNGPPQPFFDALLLLQLYFVPFGTVLVLAAGLVPPPLPVKVQGS